VRLIKFTELKGILALSGIALIFATVYLGFRGTISEWIGRPITLKDPITNKIVFVSDRGGQPDLWIMDPDGSNQKALTNDALVETSPAVSPDGLTIAYIGRDGSGNTEVYAVDADGTHRRRITKITGAKSDLKFSPDGRRIIFLASGEVWQVDKQGNHPKRLLPTEQEMAMQRFNDRRSAYIWADESPAGGVIAAIRNEDEGKMAVWLVPGEDVTQPIVDVVEQQQIPLIGENACAAWATDEQRLAVTLTGRDDAGMLVVVDYESDTVNPIFGGSLLGAIEWSSNGSVVAVEHLKRVAADQYDIIGLLIADIATGETREIEGAVSHFKWSPDGETLVYSQDGDLYIVKANSNEEPVNLTKGKGRNTSPTWAPEAVR